MSSEDDSASGVTWRIDDFHQSSVSIRPLPLAVETHIQNLHAHRIGVALNQQDLLAIEEVKDRVKLRNHQLSAAHCAITNMRRGMLFTDDQAVRLLELANEGVYDTEDMPGRWSSVFEEVEENFSHDVSSQTGNQRI